MKNLIALLRQPTNIHALGVIAGGVGAALSHFATGNPKVDILVGAVAYVLVHLGVNDNSGGGTQIAQLTTDLANAAVQRKLAQVAPELFGEGVAALEALLQPPAPVAPPGSAPPGSAPRGSVLAAGGAIAAALGLFLLCGALAGCGQTATVAGVAITAPPVPATPDQAVAELEAAYTGGVGLATSYLLLPRCGMAVVLCSSPTAVAELVTDQGKASKALTALRAALATYDAITKPAAGDTATFAGVMSDATVAITAFTAAAQRGGAT